MLFAVMCISFLKERALIHVILGESTLNDYSENFCTLSPRFHVVSWCRKLFHKKQNICHQLLEPDGTFTFAVKSMFEGKKHRPASLKHSSLFTVCKLQLNFTEELLLLSSDRTKPAIFPHLQELCQQRPTTCKGH